MNSSTAVHGPAAASPHLPCRSRGSRWPRGRHDPSAEDLPFTPVTSEDLRPPPTHREKPRRSFPPPRWAETRRTAPTLEDSRDDARPDQPYFGEGSRRGSRALVTTRLSRECLRRSRCLRNLYRSRGTGGQVPYSPRWMAIIVGRPGGNMDPVCRGIIFLVLETSQPIPVVA